MKNYYRIEAAAKELMADDPTLPMGIALRMVEAFNENHDDKTGEFSSGDGGSGSGGSGGGSKGGGEESPFKNGDPKARSSSLNQEEFDQRFTIVARTSAGLHLVAKHDGVMGRYKKGDKAICYSNRYSGKTVYHTFSG